MERDDGDGFSAAVRSLDARGFDFGEFRGLWQIVRRGGNRVVGWGMASRRIRFRSLEFFSERGERRRNRHRFAGVSRFFGRHNASRKGLRINAANFDVSVIAVTVGLGSDVGVGVEEHMDGASIDVIHAEYLDVFETFVEFVV